MSSLLTTIRKSSLGWLIVPLVVLAAATGLALARLPLLWAAIGLLVAVLVVATLVDPLVGIGVVLILGPTKPLTDYFVPQLPLDIGQIALIITLGAWLLHAVRDHRITIPGSPLNLPLIAFIVAISLSMVNALSIGYSIKELIKWAQLLIVMWLVIGERRWKTVVGLVIAAALAQALIGIWQFGIRGDGPEHFLILGGRFYRAYGTFEQPNPYAGFIGLVLPLCVGLTLGALSVWLRNLTDDLLFTSPLISGRPKPTAVLSPLHKSAKLTGEGEGAPPTAARKGVRSILSRLRRTNLLKVALHSLNRDALRLSALIVLCGVLLAALLMSWSRGAWLGFGAACVAILFAWPRKAWVGALLVIGGALAMIISLRFNLLPASIAGRLTGFTDFIQTFDVRGVDVNDANYAVLERLAHWQAAESMAQYHPWFGVGIGNYEPVYPAYSLINWPAPLGHAHNIYLNMLAETGVVGLVTYAALWITVIWQTWRVTRYVDVWQRSLAIGLFGTWAHLSMHSFLDKLYVANLHLHIGALLGILSVLILIGDKFWQKKQTA